MKIVSWNMQHWSRTPAERRAAWRHLGSLDADFALVQECNPTGEFPPSHVVYRETALGPRNRWGTAVVSFGNPLMEVSETQPPSARAPMSIYRAHPGCVAVARAASGLVLVSVYGQMEGGYAITTVHRLLSDLTPLVDSREGRRLVLGGDLNVSTQFKAPDRVRHQHLFQRFGTLGLVDCLALDRPARSALEGCPCGDSPCRHVHTHKHNRSRVPWHLDYIFVSAKLAGSVTACYGESGVSGLDWSLSDHRPIALQLD